jgi:hypothetical protein
MTNALPARSFPQPFVITVGMVKGGSCKTWWALNLSSSLGLAGYRVLAVDLNPQHDLAADHAVISSQRVYPRFEVESVNIFGRGNGQTLKPNFGGYKGFDFVVVDTPQFLFPQVKAAWENCHLMLMPLSPDGADYKNYANAVAEYRALKARAPVICMPSKISRLKNDLGVEALNDCLDLMRKQGCETPSYPPAFLVDYNRALAVQGTRWVLDKRLFRGVERVATKKFLDVFNLNLGWLLMTIQKHYGPLPAPPLPVVGGRGSGPDEVYARLEAEFEARNAKGAAAAAP